MSGTADSRVLAHPEQLQGPLGYEVTKPQISCKAALPSRMLERQLQEFTEPAGLLGD